ncbi:putativelike c6 zinc cluster transcription [Phaeomoniella chlamydospora]|uniref:Putativelike c6 zinc cluster transcription n=1 Tax=Phaeomoniella chlamydospora TaxID=158046 RepID=A0A0G2F050_PHACM|nr:putativelike c6 zinc cluster transcription [Phaeomoniella chlamydospora]
MSSTEANVHCTCEARQAEKLKDSCDACARAKTKCNRDFNGCARCKRRGESCHYSRARRIGKHRATCATSIAAKARKEAALRAQQRSDSVSSLSQPSTPVLQSGVDYTSSPRNTAGSSSASSLPAALSDHKPDGVTSLEVGEGANLLMGLENSGMGYDMGPFGNFMTDPWFSSPEASNLITSTSTETIDLASCIPFAQLNHALTKPNDITLKTPIPSQGSFDFAEQCYNLAYSTLQSLHFPAASCSTPPSFFDPVTANLSVDHIFERNRAAIQNLRTILTCPCIFDTNLAMLCAMIINQIVDSYRQGQQSNSPSPSTPPGSSFQDLPMKIGNFQLDHRSKAQVVAQLVIVELTQLKKMVEMAVNRYSGLDKAANDELEGCQKCIETTINEMSAELDGR